jgi:hypothetical protein
MSGVRVDHGRPTARKLVVPESGETRTDRSRL